MTTRNIYFLVTKAHGYTIGHHLETWGRSLRSFVRPVFYEDVVRYRSLRVGTYIFSDLERLSAPQMQLAGLVWDALQIAGAPLKRINNPRRALRREALLRALHTEGINPFRVYRVNEDLSGARYPLFIRRENEHDGSLSPLIPSAAELPAAIAAARGKGVSDDELLVVEHLNTADSAGIYRKYAAFRIGSQVFPFHINFAKSWVVKRSEFLTPELEAEEAAFRATTQWNQQLREIFERANVEFGRVDFSIVDGRIVVWEINTNPSLGGDPFRAKPHRLPIIHAMCKDLNEGLAALRPEIGVAPGESIPFQVPAPLLRELGVGPREQLARQAKRALRQIAQASPWRRAV